MNIRIDSREFSRTLREYMSHTKKTLPEIVNNKAFFVARGATRATYKADVSKIESELGVEARAVRQIKRGKNAGKFRRGDIVVGSNRAQGRTLAELILLKRDRDKGVAGTGTMAERVHRFIKARMASVAYIKSGWIPAIKYFQKLRTFGSGPSQDKSAKLRATYPIGGGKAAVPGMKVEAWIWNAATTKHNTPGSEKALEKYASEGLQKAMDDETKSMSLFIESQMQKMTDKVVGRFLR